MAKVRVTVALEVDLEEAAACGQVMAAGSMLGHFQQQGEAWQQEAREDPLWSRFVAVRVEMVREHSGG